MSEPKSLGVGRLELPSIAQLDKLARSENPLDQAIFELWRGRAPVSSVTAARLTREQADALLLALEDAVDG